jgi:hypothetical protein
VPWGVETLSSSTRAFRLHLLVFPPFFKHVLFSLLSGLKGQRKRKSEEKNNRKVRKSKGRDNKTRNRL